MRRLWILSLAVLLVGTTPVAAATLPFLEAFDDDPLGTAPPTAQGEAWDPWGDWTVETDGAGHDYRSVVGPGGQARGPGAAA